MNQHPTLSTRPTLLIVDDAPDNLALMSGLLKDIYKVKTATNGVNALRIARTDPPPHLILLDIMMPDMDGYAVCTQLKADARTRDIPVIFLTAKALVEDEQQGFAVGAVDYITKPISEPIVKARIHTHLELRAARVKVEMQGKALLQKREHELQEFKDALDQHAIVSIADRAGNILYVNQKFCEVSGYSYDELIGNNHRILNDGMDPAIYQDLWKTITSGRVWHGELRNKRKDGRHYWVESSIIPMSFDGNGVPERYISIRTEVTALKAIQEALVQSEERFARSQNYANVGTWDWDLVTDSVICSERVGALLGGLEGVATLTASNFLNAVHPLDQDSVAAAITDCIESGKALDVEHRVLRPDGEIHWVHHKGNVVRTSDGQPQHLLGVVNDVTRRKRSEELMLAAKEEAERASSAKSEFLSCMSHELRTPLNAILGFAQLLESDPEEPLSQSQKESVGQILQAGWHLLTLINEVLDLARIESGKVNLDMRDIGLKGILGECMNLLSPLSAEKQIRMSLSAEIGAVHQVRADEMRLKQVLLNLLSNAIKYNREQGEVTVSLLAAGEQRLRIAVSDTGRGLNEDQLAHLFEAFNRVGAENSEISGSGIGLVVAKRYVEIMDGEIGVHSCPGEGSTFWVELPEAEGV